MIVLFLIAFCVLCKADYGDLGYNLNIGHAIDVFANYGDLSQVTQVASADYEEEIEEEIEPFREKNLKVFEDATSQEKRGDSMNDINILLCETFDDLLGAYFQNFQIEGTSKPWKAFMGDWILDEIMRTFGIEYNGRVDDCCYVLVKLTKIDVAVKINDLTDVTVKGYISDAVDQLNVHDETEMRLFMKSYGSHYIDSYATGNFIYQVFKYKRTGYNLLRSYIRVRNHRHSTSDNLRYYFSSIFLKEVGDIKVASGNKTVETWARRNLRDSQYLYSRPSLLRLHYNPKLAFKLNDLVDNKALLGLKLKILRPLFKDQFKQNRYAELVENDMQLWEVNA